MAQIYCSPDEQIIEISRKETILEASIYSGIPHNHACGGNARCSTCRILILEGLEFCSQRTDVEQKLASKLHLPNNIRLACQTKVNGDISLRRLVLDHEDEELAETQLTFGSIGEEKALAVMFVDIRGFTKLAESMLPYDVIYFLNRYFHSMGQVVNRYEGMINNYMGDGFMALFGVETSEGAAELAVRAAVEMIEVVKCLSTQMESLYHRPLKIGIGIHYGLVVLGSVHASNKTGVTAIGDVVNFASRIESANKICETTLLISEETYEFVKENAILESCHLVSLPGKSGQYTLYEVIGMSGSAPQTKRASKQKQSLFSSILDWLRHSF